MVIIMSKLFLYEKIREAKKYIKSPEVPDFILDNITTKFELRDYQYETISDTILLMDNPQIQVDNNHLLFHMATGSGKTLIMVMMILYYYSKGYRNFLFFTQQTSVVVKTKMNFTNNQSSKYLFADNIVIDGENVNINVVNNFEGANPKDINIVFQTTAGLHSSLFFVKENSLTINDFEREKIVLIADEAHKLNAATKRLSNTDSEIEKTWEYTITRILNANNDNKLLEFTATANLKHPNIRDKYRDKVVFDFPLEKFREAGYTKEFNNFSSNVDKWTRSLQALIMSQYRKLMFNSHNIYSKPIVMLKSLRIKDSLEFYEEFYEKLGKLSSTEIIEIKNANQNENNFLNNAFMFFEEINLSIESLVEMIKLDFSQEHALLMNGSSTEDDVIYNIAASLDEPTNHHRIIFTVDKLNEGWDVLGLFDIVRLLETRQGGPSGTPSPFTISEAQLIGRGARYFPFKFEENQDEFKNKYRNDIHNPEAVCETLLFHSINDSRYINELKKALQETGFEPKTKVEINHKLKKQFKQSDVYQKGFIFVNERKEKNRTNIESLPATLKSKVFTQICSTSSVRNEALFGRSESRSNKIALPPLRLKNIDQNILFSALRKNHSTLPFNRLKLLFPNIKSQHEFLTSPNYLGDISIIFYVEEGDVPSRDDLLKATMKVLESIKDYIRKTNVLFEGTKEFKAKPIYEVIKDKTSMISHYRLDGGSYGEGISQSDLKVPDEFRVKLEDKSWYAFEDNFGTSEEKKFVSYFNSIILELEEKYDDVFLIRNERFFELYSFDDGERFEPDYIVILNKKEQDFSDYLCLFVEPKGEHLLETDKWKENFLLSLEKESVPIITFKDDTNYKIFGAPFFNNTKTKEEFVNYFSRKIL